MIFFYVVLIVIAIIVIGKLVQKSIDTQIAIERESKRDASPELPCCGCCKCSCHNNRGIADGGSFGLG